MSVLWLAPAALLGLGLIAVPVAIHLLVRQQSRRIDYPSLRFLHQSQLAAFRWRRVQDALLLACRAAIIAAAVAALAGPVFQGASRTAGYDQRVVRAVVLEPGSDATLAADAAAGSFASRTFSRARLADGIAEAVRWMDGQPPATREVVLAGAFRLGSVSPTQLDAVPSFAGIRFVRLPGDDAARDLPWPVLRISDGLLVMQARQLRLEDDATRMTDGTTLPVAPETVRVIAAAADQPLADAALRVALGAGVRSSDASARVLVVWDGADEAAVSRVQDGALLVKMARPAPASSAASAMVEAIEHVTAAPVGTLEPVRISDEQLNAWSRPPGPVPGTARPADEGDRRWLWGLALVLLGVEQALRRPPGRRDAADGEEARVA
jgi:hypothetical protein